MNKFERDITYQGDMRLVGGVVTKRDADFGILFERDNYLNIVKKLLHIQSEDIDQYEDHQVLDCTLSNGSVVALKAEHSAAFSASEVEKFIRSGVSHIIRIGTCGALDEKIKPWDIILNYASLIDESTSMKYKEQNRTFFKSILDELICPLGILNHTYEILPKFIQTLLNLFNKNPYQHFTVSSDIYLDSILYSELKLQLKKSNTQLHRAINYTGSARYRQNKKLVSKILKDIPVKTIDMETSAILSTAAFHKIPASIINIRTDNPMSEQYGKCKKMGLKTTLHGIPDHKLYNDVIPDKIKLCTKAVMNTFSKISNDENYPKLINYNKR
jgi:purine-nucleoside phosphorylase